MIDDRRRPSAPPPRTATPDAEDTVQILAGDVAAARRTASRRLRVPNDPVPRRSSLPAPPVDGAEADGLDTHKTDPSIQTMNRASIVPPPPDDPSVVADALRSIRQSVAPPSLQVSSVARVSVKPPSFAPPPLTTSSVVPRTATPMVDEGGVVRQVRRKIRSVGTGEAPSAPPPRRGESAPEAVAIEPRVASIPVPMVVPSDAVGDDFVVPPVSTEPARDHDVFADDDSVDVSVDETTTSAEEAIDDAEVVEPADDVLTEATTRGAPPPAPARAVAQSETAPQRPPPPPPLLAKSEVTKPTSSEAAREARTTVRDEAPRRKRRAWWEELFNDDYFRTMPKFTTEQVTAEGDFIESSLGVEKGAVVLDVACGTGRQAVELAARGYEVIALDLSLAMLSRAADTAQDRGTKLNFLHSDMREMEFFEMFDAAYCMNSAFGYFEDDKNVDVARRLHTSLKAGGTLLLDVLNRDFAIQNQPSMAWYEGDGCVCMEETNFNYITSRLVVKRTMIFDDGRQRELEYSIRLYSLHELGKILHNAGFRIVEVSGHPRTPGAFFGAASRNVIILAQKQAAPGTRPSSLPPNSGAAGRPTTSDPSSSSS